MVKEGILLDREGNEIPTRPAQKKFALSLGPLAGTIAGAALIALIAFAGMTLFGVLVAIFAAIWIIRTILSLFGFVRPRSRSSTVFYTIRRGR